MDGFAGHVDGGAFRGGGIDIVLERPRLLDGVVVELHLLWQGHLEQLGSRLRGIGTAAQQFGLGCHLSLHLRRKGIEVGFPAHIVEVFQKSLPLLVGIVAAQ